MRLKNGTDEDQTVIAAVWASLGDLKAEHGKNGLLLARRYALGSGKGADMLSEYGLTKGKVMSVPVRNVILSAITQHGALVNPVQR